MGKHRSKAEWQQVIDEQKQSGLNVSAYCRQNNLLKSSFHHARKMLRNRQREQFAELERFQIFDGESGVIERGGGVLNFECSADGLRYALGAIRSMESVQEENSLNDGARDMQEYTAERWSRIVADQEKSNLNAKEYCARNNIRVEQFYKQKRMLKKFEKSDLFFEIDCLPVFEETEDMIVNFDGIILRLRQITAQDFRKVLEVVRAVRLEFPVNRQAEEGHVNG